MNLDEWEERAYMECKTCCWGVSGVDYKIEDKAFQHERDNPGHKMRYVYDEDK